jgi:hypothetical protein
MDLFRKPFPHSTSKWGWFKTGLAFCIFIFAFIFIFKPFELDKVSTSRLFEISSIFGFIAFACYFFPNLLLHYFFPKTYSEEKWTTGKQILNVALVLVLIGFMNHLAFNILYGTSFSWKNFFLFQVRTTAVGLLPITGYTLYIQNRWLHKFKMEAAKLQEKLDEKREADKKADNRLPVPQDDVFSFESENQKDKFTINANKLVYIEAASNYIKLYYEEQAKTSFSIIRMTMKNAAEITEPHLAFFRCHRAFIVNLDKVERIDGNAQGYKLKLLGADELVPVSKNLNKEFSDRVLAVRNRKFANNR